MSKALLIELFGYLGSFLVLVSFLTTSVVKLRVINTIGSLIFMTYALIIKSYPTAIMNFCLVLINVRFLWKMTRIDKAYDIIEIPVSDYFDDYFISYYKDDIENCFPGVSLDFKDADFITMIFCDCKPVGMTVGDLEDDTLKLMLDYTISEYRDFSIGSHMFEFLKNKGIKKVVFSGPTVHHMADLKKFGFEKNGEEYVKTL